MNMNISIDKDTREIITRSDLIQRIRELKDIEKFKQDAFFFCGFPSEAPNEELMYACAALLDLEEKLSVDDAAKARLVDELNKALNKDSGLKDNMNITDSKNEIRDILDHIDLL